MMVTSESWLGTSSSSLLTKKTLLTTTIHNRRPSAVNLYHPEWKELLLHSHMIHNLRLDHHATHIEKTKLIKELSAAPVDIIIFIIVYTWNGKYVTLNALWSIHLKWNQNPLWYKSIRRSPSPLTSSIPINVPLIKKTELGLRSPEYLSDVWRNFVRAKSSIQINTCFAFFDRFSSVSQA